VSKVAGQAEAASIRRAQALKLRIAGYSFTDIGRALHVSNKTAYYDVHRELAALDGPKAKMAERVLGLSLDRLDKAIVGLQVRVEAGEPNAVFALVKVEERRAKLLGLDAPTKVAPTSPDGGVEYGSDGRAALAAAIAKALGDAESDDPHEPE
jgi:hypothetical protein